MDTLRAVPQSRMRARSRLPASWDKGGGARSAPRSLPPARWAACNRMGTDQGTPSTRPARKRQEWSACRARHAHASGCSRHRMARNVTHRKEPGSCPRGLAGDVLYSNVIPSQHSSSPTNPRYARSSRAGVSCARISPQTRTTRAQLQKRFHDSSGAKAARARPGGA